MNIDAIFNIFVLPLLRFPVVMVLIITSVTKHDFRGWLWPTVAYSLLLNTAVVANNKFKRRGPWVNLRKLENATCVVTGGSSGLGLAIIQQFISRIHNLKIVSLDVVPPKFTHPRLDFRDCDLSDPSSVDRVIKEIKKDYGEVHVLVNNAGIRGKYQNFCELQKKDVNCVFQVNVFSPMRLIQLLSPKKAEKRQFYAITIASTLGICTPARGSSYGASKAALISFHEAWTQELGDASNVRTLLVTPGQLDTAMFSGFEPPKQFFAPVVNPRELARQIVDKCSAGERGELSAPLYANFMGILRTLPYTAIYFARKASGMDSCLPVE
ncbi:Tda5p [Lachancea thermotolerans CBS 6340]|uniref:KLTH0D15774p n=1 Tax=Lachancea thermotolerans (strain ATCC 56472 / CBS 6340 / NRRL Y-8284) TaxID=559295 RepID=C5DFK1_LACTC|nr:KLTH0D15774p [Lachancea thermotolerans CBS 6340]CAR22956.1 KLTH0D15774p [Lachancea thermotolerans CBS 6340]